MKIKNNWNLKQFGSFKEKVIDVISNNCYNDSLPFATL